MIPVVPWGPAGPDPHRWPARRRQFRKKGITEHLRDPHSGGLGAQAPPKRVRRPASFSRPRLSSPTYSVFHETTCSPLHPTTISTNHSTKTEPDSQPVQACVLQDFLRFFLELPASHCKPKNYVPREGARIAQVLCLRSSVLCHPSSILRVLRALRGFKLSAATEGESEFRMSSLRHPCPSRQVSTGFNQ